MKLLVVVIAVAVLTMFVCAEDTAAVIKDSKDTNDVGLSSGLFGGLKPPMRFYSSSSGSSSKSKNSKIYDLIKSVIKLLTKVLSNSDATQPASIPGAQQH